MVCAVLLHPHPDMGGDQYNPVISALYDRFAGVGTKAYRFDFSSSEPATARREAMQQIEAAGEPVILVGYSFGGGIAASILHLAVVGWGLVAPALNLTPPLIGADPRPKHLVIGALDQWLGPEVVGPITAGWHHATSETVNADHFFAGPAVATAASAIVEWARPRFLR